MTANDPERADQPADDWSPLRVCLWSFAAMAALAVYVPAYLAAIRPPEGTAADFLQEWLSARHFAHGGSIYAPQAETAQLYLGVPPEAAADMLPWNAHPPVSVLVVLPLGLLDYRDAHFSWNLLNLPILALCVVVLVRGLRFPFGPLSWLPTVALSLACYPLYYQLSQGNLNGLLLGILMFAWVALRRGWNDGAGFAIGIAAAVKLFPAFLFVYLIASRRWRAAGIGIAAFIGLNAIALALFGIGAFQAYFTEVIPSTTHYLSCRQNASLVGFWLRLFDPDPIEHIVPLASLPWLATALSLATRLAVVGIVAVVARRSADTDRAFALAVVGMLLVAPVSWSHYFLLLALPLGLVWFRLHSWFARRFLWLAFAIIWLPTYYLPVAFGGGDHTASSYLLGRSDLSPAHNLALASLPNYALLVLFALVLLARTATNTEANRAAASERAEAPLIDFGLRRGVRLE